MWEFQSLFITLLRKAEVMGMLALVCCMSVLLAHTAVFAAEPQIQTSAQSQFPSMASEAQGTPAFQPALERIAKTAGTAGVIVASLSSGKVVCEFQPKEMLVPASLMKLLTSYAALKKLGPSFRFTTKVMAAEEPVEGVISGDIWIKGSGDPFFASENALQLAKAVREKGIRQIRGSILVDDTFFRPMSERVCLDSDCVGVYNPVISAAAIDFNTLTVKVTGPVKAGKAFSVDSGLADGYVRVSGQASLGKKGRNSLRLRSFGATDNGQEQFQLSGRASARTRAFRFNAADPAGLFAHAMRAALERSGVRVLGTGAKEGTTPRGAEVIVSYDSPRLVELISGLNRYSNNFMAEMLLKSLGGYVAGAPGDSQKGIAVVRTTLREAAIPEEIGTLDCGSGLSRFCRISPETFCRLLAAAWNDDEIREEFISSLAANGEQGTLKRRMHEPGLKVRGKTGTLNDVIGFAGYVSGPSGQTYAAVVMLNEVRDRFKARQAVDSLIEQVAFSGP
jgi:D-alanyl-D-alanine carboxypeptidase/D-alanyl-D-alanine-endopeptidase (penicillin-binding protein 4)